MFNTIRTALKIHQNRRQTINELSRLSNRDLADIGVNRCDIYAIARRDPNSI
jgi:uncharacterized protein YjiS (DUF1127 family)